MRDRHIDPEAAIFAAEIGEVPIIDLHGQSVDLATSNLDNFINHECLQGSEAIKIIYGQGTGKLASGVRIFLKKHPLVLLTKESDHGGAIYAALEYTKKSN